MVLFIYLYKIRGYKFINKYGYYVDKKEKNIFFSKNLFFVFCICVGKFFYFWIFLKPRIFDFFFISFFFVLELFANYRSHSKYYYYLYIYI